MDLPEGLDLAELKRVAEAATPGPWRSNYEHVWQADVSYRVGSCDWDLSGSRPTDQCFKDAVYIATFDPPTVKALIDRVETAEQARSEAVRLMSQYAREAGEATGRLEMSETAGIVDGWRERAEKAERNYSECLAENDAFEAQVARLEADLARARDALGPFAVITPSSFYPEDGSEAELYLVVLYDGTRHVPPHDFTGADLARASEVLTSLSEEGE